MQEKKKRRTVTGQEKQAREKEPTAETASDISRTVVKQKQKAVSAEKKKKSSASRTAKGTVVQKEQRHTGRIVAEVAVSAALLVALRFTLLHPFLDGWTEVSTMSGSTWLEENAQQVSFPTGNPTEATEPESEEPEDLYESVSIENTEIHNGDLILVNGDYAYESTDEEELKTLYGNKSDSYYVSGSELMLREDVITNLNAMLDDFYTETGHSDIIIISGYRTSEQQQELYDADLESTGLDTSTLVAKPGHSEHETGYAMDFSLFDGENSDDYDGTGEYNWINENCAHYGFVLRYPEEKTEITEIQYESWHYRYVGQPHAFYMQQNQLCLEEYMEELQNHTIDNALEVTNWDGKVYQVYYVPAESGDSTYVMVPPDLEYMISGNNVDGFIVTVDTGVTNLDAVKEEPTTADTEESTEDAESWDAGEAETATEPEEDVDWDAETE